MIFMNKIARLRTRFPCHGLVGSVWLYFLVCIAAAEEKTPGIVDGRATKGMSIELLSEVKSLREGEAFWVGLSIQHDPGFHTYWKNPGVVGVPTQIQWELPEGYTASDIHWPYPEKSMMAEYPCFAYKRDVLLRVLITPPAEVELEQVTFTAMVNWMCCSSVCYPDSALFSLTLPVGDGLMDQRWKAVFAEAKKSMPKVSDKVSATLLSQKDAEWIQIRIESEFPIVSVFSADGQTTPDLPFQLMKEAKGIWRFKAKRSEYGPEGCKTFPLIAETDAGFFTVIAR